MKQLILLLVLAMIATSCGKGQGSDSSDIDRPVTPKFSPLYVSSDSTFDPFVSEFLTHYLLFNSSNFTGDLPNINFHDLSTLDFVEMGATDLSSHFFNAANTSNTMAGICLEYENGDKEILIDTEAWNNTVTNYERQKVLIWHELGHCVLLRSHKDTKYRGYNLSLMNSILISRNDYVRFENTTYGEVYAKELFTHNHSDLSGAIDDYLDP